MEVDVVAAVAVLERAADAVPEVLLAALDDVVSRPGLAPDRTRSLLLFHVPLPRRPVEALLEAKEEHAACQPRSTRGGAAAVSKSDAANETWVQNAPR